MDGCINVKLTKICGKSEIRAYTLAEGKYEVPICIGPKITFHQFYKIN